MRLEGLVLVFTNFGFALLMNRRLPGFLAALVSEENLTSDVGWVACVDLALGGVTIVVGLVAEATYPRMQCAPVQIVVMAILSSSFPFKRFNALNIDTGVLARRRHTFLTVGSLKCLVMAAAHISGSIAVLPFPFTLQIFFIVISRLCSEWGLSSYTSVA